MSSLYNEMIVPDPDAKGGAEKKPKKTNTKTKTKSSSRTTTSKSKSRSSVSKPKSSSRTTTSKSKSRSSVAKAKPKKVSKPRSSNEAPKSRLEYLDKILPFLSDAQRKKFAVDSETVVDLLDSRTANKISFIMYYILNNSYLLPKKAPEVVGGCDVIGKGEDFSLQKKFTVCDGTAGIGGSLIGFDKAFKSIIAVESDPGKFAMLKNNIDVCELKSVEAVNKNFNEFIVGKKFDGIFLNPSWDRNHSKDKPMEVSIDGKSLREVIENNVKNNSSEVLIVKLPYGVDDSSIRQLCNGGGCEFAKFKDKRFVLFIVGKKINERLPGFVKKFSS